MRTREQILVDFLGNFYHSGGEMLFHCPYCDHHKKKLSVNIEKNVFKCWICDASGTDLGKIVHRFADFQARQEWSELCGKVDISAFENLFKPPEEKREATVSLPDEFVSLTNKSLLPSNNLALHYLQSRGLTREDILKWKIGYCGSGEYHGRVVFPSFNKDGYVNYFVTRAYGNGWPKYKNSPTSRDIVFNDLYVDWNSDIVLVEGPFDAVKAGNSIPLLGSTLRQNSLLFNKIVSSGQRIFLALDEDASKKEYRIATLLLSYGVNVYKIGTAGYEDVGAMTRQQFQARKKDSAFVDRGHYLIQNLFTS